MKAQEDIERQLAAAQDAWETPPSSALWESLAQRLDAQALAQAPTTPRRWPFRLVMIALLATASLGTWWMLPQSKAASTDKGKAFAKHTVSMLPNRPIADAGLDATVSKPANRLSFGANIGIGKPRPTLDRQPRIGPKIPSFSQQHSSSIFSMNGSGRLLLNGSTNAASPTYNGNPQPMSSQNPADPQFNASTIYRSAHDMLVSNSFGNPIDTVHSLRQFSNLNLARDNAYLQINAASNDMNFNYAVQTPADNQQNVQHLKWLLGSWKTQGSSGGTIEEWRQKDDFTLVGRGYFVVNRDTIVTEEMRIEQRGPNMYFIIAKDQNHKSMKFRLRSSMPNELIFQNAASQDDDELVLRNRPSTNELERVLQAPPSKSLDNNTSREFHPPRDQRVMKRNL
jgi:Domain of unknown function (DUF6265)